jgi:probable F420-dependent oxidoreductase
MLRPFRFAVQSFSATDAGEWRDRARRIEDLGYEALHLADHFLGAGPALESTRHPHQTLAAIPAIATAAAVTSTLRIGCRVFCNDYHHPVILAKEVATLDLLSDGRIDFGLGAGWLRAEYQAAGMKFDGAGVRIDRLEESIALIKALWSGRPVEHAGRHYTVSGFTASPAPIQKPYPRLMIGGGGRRVLSLAAREADVVSFNFDNRSGTIGPAGVKSATAKATAEKIEWVRAAAGDRFDALELEIGAYFTFVTDDAHPIAAGMGKAMGLSVDEMLDHPHGLFGPVDAICDRLEERRERYGISRIAIGDDALEAFSPVVARLAGR